MNLNDLAVECNEVSRSKGWLEEERSFGDLISLMHSELSEALEQFRLGRGFNEIYWQCKNCVKISESVLQPWPQTCDHSDYETCQFQPEGIPIELSDVIIRALQACGNLEINIQYAYNTKMEYNKTRPHRHGGKKI